MTLGRLMAQRRAGATRRHQARPGSATATQPDSKRAISALLMSHRGSARDARHSTLFFNSFQRINRVSLRAGGDICLGKYGGDHMQRIAAC